MRPGSAYWRRERGFTYVWVMAMVAVLGIGLAAIGPLWSDATRREREADALRIGELYARAIASYYTSSPGSEKRYPPSLDALLLDTRFVGTYRHLRRLYGDPLKSGESWGVLRGPDGSVRGVVSRSDDEPLRHEPLDLGITVLTAAQKYSEWQFVPKVD
ncbi:MAG TPA: type II secretion system protein [Albitalea sp.]|uniref:type II secretion system protein n=1 Tax=Piscinibacter sp. TaxID=1903157 RepID=UPI002ED3EF4A